MIYDIFEGTAEIQQLVIARAITGMHIKLDGAAATQKPLRPPAPTVRAGDGCGDRSGEQVAALADVGGLI